MNADELKIVADLFAASTERIADAIARAVGSAVAEAVRSTMPPPMPEAPIREPRDITAADLRQLLTDQIDPTDNDGWLGNVTTTPTANMGPPDAT